MQNDIIYVFKYTKCGKVGVANTKYKLCNCTCKQKNVKGRVLIYHQNLCKLHILCISASYFSIVVSISLFLFFIFPKLKTLYNVTLHEISKRLRKVKNIQKCDCWEDMLILIYQHVLKRVIFFLFKKKIHSFR